MALRFVPNNYSPLDAIFDMADQYTTTRVVSLPLSQQSVAKPHEQIASLASDFVETSDAFRIVTDVPGMENVNANIEKHILTIQADRTTDKRSAKDRVYALERKHGKMQRKFLIPKTADVDKAEAKLDNGVLTVTIPKKAPEVAAAPRTLLSFKHKQEDAVHPQETLETSTDQTVTKEVTAADSTISSCSVSVEDVEDDNDQEYVMES
jgi:HSP20 family molecular chaperone IbpA